MRKMIDPSGFSRRVLRGILGVRAIVIGLAIIAWIGYNEFVERLPQYMGFHWWEPFGIAPILISTGWYWLPCLRPRRRYNVAALQPPA
jgi:ABC-type Fe3+ transport system permease subunit